MKKVSMKRLVAACVFCYFSSSASANSFGFNSGLLEVQSNTVNVSVIYDFTEFPMFGGKVDIIYDPAAIEFAGFEPGLLPNDTRLDPPFVNVITPGLIEGFGLVANFNSGIGSQATLGTFSFDFLGSGNAGATPCGAVLCIVGNPVNPFVSLMGFDETQDILANGITVANIATPIPLPAAFWLLLIGVGFIAGLRRTA